MQCNRRAINHLRSRREFIKLGLGAWLERDFLGGIAVASPTSYQVASSAAKIYLEPFNYTGVRLLEGMLRNQSLAARDFYFKIPDNDLLLGFRKRAGQPAAGKELPGWYGMDVFNAFGQWLSGMARLSRATGDSAMREKARQLVREWGRTIESDGYFYYSRQPTTPHYTYEKMVCGLVDIYEYAGEKEALFLLQKITAWAAEKLDRSRKSPTPEDSSADGTEWYTLSENLYRAYLLTGNSSYKTFGDLWRYTRYWDMFSGDAEPAPHGLHAYSHCNTLSSAAMAYAVTGDRKYLKTIVNAYDYFERTQFYATGGYGPDETLVAPHGSLGESLVATHDSFETPCGSWAGFKLGRYLMQFTGRSKYGDWIEKLVYNGIGAALPPKLGDNDTVIKDYGDTFYYSDYNLTGGQKVYYREAYPCCSGSYLQAVADYHNLIYFKNPTSLFVNLFVPSEVDWNYEGNEVHVAQETDYPESDTTALTVRLKKSVAFDLKIRVPGWCQGAMVAVNGSKVEVACEPGTWATIGRTWNPGDRVMVRIPMSLRLVAIDKHHPNRVALMYGPVVLVRLHEARLSSKGAVVAQWIVPTGKPLEFRAVAQPTGTFVPFYKVRAATPYGMYFDLDV